MGLSIVVFVNFAEYFSHLVFFLVLVFPRRLAEVSNDLFGYDSGVGWNLVKPTGCVVLIAPHEAAQTHGDTNSLESRSRNDFRAQR